VLPAVYSQTPKNGKPESDSPERFRALVWTPG
jgi:hypothetical protein